VLRARSFPSRKENIYVAYLFFSTLSRNFRWTAEENQRRYEKLKYSLEKYTMKKIIMIGFVPLYLLSANTMAQGWFNMAHNIIMNF
jgi:hypothetical protein